MPHARAWMHAALKRRVERPMGGMIALLLLFLCAPALATRGKDVADFHGMRDNQITGAGLVVGLNRTGDSPRSRASIRTLGNRLEGLGVSVDDEDILARNVALVMVTATLGPDVRTGQRLDVTVASTGDARSLEGGYLLMSPLMGPDGKVYAVAEGAVIVGGYIVDSAGSTTKSDTVTSGRVAGGALVEREVASRVDWNTLDTVEYVLHRADFTTATRLADAIDASFGAEVAEPVSSTTVLITVPAEFKGKFVAFAAKVEGVELEVDTPARVVVSERTGTVVMGADVKIAPVAVAHGGLTIEVKRSPFVSQPAPFSRGTTVAGSESDITVVEAEGKLTMVEGTTVGDLVSGLNALGVKPRDLIVILQAIQTAGALQAEIVAM